MSTSVSISPEEVVRSLSPEEKSRVFFVLLRQVLELHNPCGPIPLFTDAGESLGTFYPAALEQQRYNQLLQDMPPEVRDDMTRPFPVDFDPDDCLTHDEVKQIIDEALQKSR
jgi:hypothetical protein